MSTLPKQQGAAEEGLKSHQEVPDHAYALPACPKAIKDKLNEASATVRKLHREKRNAMARERRAKRNMQALLS